VQSPSTIDNIIFQVKFPTYLFFIWTNSFCFIFLFISPIIICQLLLPSIIIFLNFKLISKNFCSISLFHFFYLFQLFLFLPFRSFIITFGSPLPTQPQPALFGPLASHVLPIIVFSYYLCLLYILSFLTYYLLLF